MRRAQVAAGTFLLALTMPVVEVGHATADAPRAGHSDVVARGAASAVPAPDPKPVPMPRVRPAEPGPVPMPRVQPAEPGPVPMPRILPSEPGPLLTPGPRLLEGDLAPRPRPAPPLR